jgi:membrane protein implicated in regulation of membrane protease activity
VSHTFTLPVHALPLFWFLPWEEALVLYSIICLLSAGFYWLIWWTMNRPATTGIEGMMGGIGTVIRCSEGKTKVFCRGEIWDAVSKEAMFFGERVEIVGFERMRLIVRRRA